jgi:hypothetical protein
MRMTKIHFDSGPFRKKFVLTVFFTLIKRYCFAKFRRKPPESFFSPQARRIFLTGQFEQNGSYARQSRITRSCVPCRLSGRLPNVRRLRAPNFFRPLVYGTVQQ